MGAMRQKYMQFLYEDEKGRKKREMSALRLEDSWPFLQEVYCDRCGLNLWDSEQSATAGCCERGNK
jgi:hypothetical protein